MGDFDTLANSIRTKLYTLPEDTTVYSGHGSPTTVGREMRSNPYVKIERQ
jgi:glyoxylase-like metal-dependent hydrolase (beta-lactamase superfamily II)